MKNFRTRNSVLERDGANPPGRHGGGAAKRREKAFKHIQLSMGDGRKHESRMLKGEAGWPENLGSTWR
jgi:hypothetical protein